MYIPRLKSPGTPNIFYREISRASASERATAYRDTKLNEPLYEVLTNEDLFAGMGGLLGGFERGEFMLKMVDLRLELSDSGSRHFVVDVGLGVSEGC